MILKQTFALVSSILLVGTSFAAGNPETPSKELQMYPKNLARQHLGTNLLVFNPTNQTYSPTEAAAAWLDDDIATGWPTSQGKTYYLLALPEAELLTNFAISGRNTSGTLNLYTSDELAPPASKRWNPVAKNVPVESVNDHKLARPFNRYAKYLLIEADLSEAGPLYSLYLYGERPAAGYELKKRAQQVNMRSVLGPYTNPQTSINLSSLSANARVTRANSDDDFQTSQRALDDNPESEVSIAPSTSQPGIVIKYGAPQEIDRISVLADAPAAGKLEFFVINSAAPKVQTATTTGEEPQYIKASNTEKSMSSAPSAPADGNLALDGLTPSATITFDGSNPRASVDFAAATGTELVARWIPDTPDQLLKVREIGSFGAVTMNDYEVTSGGTQKLQSDSSKSGRDYKDPGDGKQLASGKDPGKEPIGEYLPTKTPYVPGQPRFGPNLPLSN